MKTIGDKIRELRGELTQSEMGEMCGVSVAYISELERGLRPGTLAVLSTIAAWAGVSVTELLSDTPYDHPQTRLDKLSDVVTRLIDELSEGHPELLHLIVTKEFLAFAEARGFKSKGADDGEYSNL